MKAAPFPLYVGGAQILENYPVGPLGGVAFNLTLLSYTAAWTWGMNIDTAAVSEPERLRRRCARRAFDGLWLDARDGRTCRTPDQDDRRRSATADGGAGGRQQGAHVEQEIGDLAGRHEFAVHHLGQGLVDDGECLVDHGGFSSRRSSILLLIDGCTVSAVRADGDDRTGRAPTLVTPGRITNRPACTIGARGARRQGHRWSPARARGIGEALARPLPCRRRAASSWPTSTPTARPRSPTSSNVVRPGSALGLGGDVSTTDGNEALIRAAEAAFGPIDLFFANAGVGIGTDLETPDDDWRLAFAVNVARAPLRRRRLLPGWLERGEGLLLLDGVGRRARSAQIGSAPYAVTKHAAVAFAEWLSITYGDQRREGQLPVPDGRQHQHAQPPARGASSARWRRGAGRRRRARARGGRRRSWPTASPTTLPRSSPTPRSVRSSSARRPTTTAGSPGCGACRRGCAADDGRRTRPVAGRSAVGDRVHFRRRANGRWHEGTVQRRERDGSIALHDRRGAARSIPSIGSRCCAPSRRGRSTWRSVAALASADEQLGLW